MRAINPLGTRFVDSTTILGGQYKGEAIIDVAKNDLGLIYLDGITRRPERWTNLRLDRAIRSFMARPHIVQRLGKLYGNTP